MEDLSLYNLNFETNRILERKYYNEEDITFPVIFDLHISGSSKVSEFIKTYKFKNRMEVKSLVYDLMNIQNIINRPNIHILSGKTKIKRYILLSSDHIDLEIIKDSFDKFYRRKNNLNNLDKLV